MLKNRVHRYHHRRFWTIIYYGEVSEWFMVTLSKFASGYPKVSFYQKETMTRFIYHQANSDFMRSI